MWGWGACGSVFLGRKLITVTDSDSSLKTALTFSQPVLPLWFRDLSTSESGSVPAPPTFSSEYQSTAALLYARLAATFTSLTTIIKDVSVPLLWQGFSHVGLGDKALVFNAPVEREHFPAVHQGRTGARRERLEDKPLVFSVTFLNALDNGNAPPRFLREKLVNQTVTKQTSWSSLEGRVM